MREKLTRFMQGRYGMDALFRAMCTIVLVLAIVNCFVRGPIISVVALLLLILAYVRVFSRNIYKRAEENRKFLVFMNKVNRFFRKWSNRLKQSKTYKFYRCPDCKQTVRVPKGKGRIEISCPKCHAKFVKKT